MAGVDGKLTAAELAAIYALVRAQAAVRQQLVDFVLASALAPLRLVNWFDPAEVAAAAERVVRVLAPTQLRMAQVTDAYLARVLTIMLGRRVGPVGAVDVTRLRRAVSPAVARTVAAAGRRELVPDGELDRFFDDLADAAAEAAERDDDDIRRRREREDDDEATRRAREDADERRRRAREDADERRRRERAGDDEATRRERDDDARRRALLQALDPMEPYVRLGAQFRYLTGRGVGEQEARERVATRAQLLAEEDISLAQRAQESQVLRQADPQQVTGFRRVLQPELGGGGPPCGLCVVAADRMYRREDLKEIHRHCRCTVLPVTPGADPGMELNVADLDRIYRAAGGTGGQKLRRLRVDVGEHGEIGPILLPYGKGFRDAEAALSERREPPIRRRIDSLQRSTDKLQASLDGGQTRLRPLVDYQTRLLRQLREQLDERVDA